ncbi:MAG TPA: hypothetical protein VFU94_13180 [Conexibacter sp.]|nr:hypothetical protein [Conexibacter sp.]
MATKAHRSRNPYARRHRKAVSRRWLLVLLTQTLARVALMLLARWLGVPGGA